MTEETNPPDQIAILLKRIEDLEKRLRRLEYERAKEKRIARMKGN